MASIEKPTAAATIPTEMFVAFRIPKRKEIENTSFTAIQTKCHQ
jgi:hypothetical protein